MKAYLFSAESEELCLFRLMGIEGEKVEPGRVLAEMDKLVRRKDYALVLVSEELARKAGLKNSDLPTKNHCLCAILPKGQYSERLQEETAGAMAAGATPTVHN